jgi:hypothetical protein
MPGKKFAQSYWAAHVAEKAVSQLLGEANSISTCSPLGSTKKVLADRLYVASPPS